MSNEMRMVKYEILIKDIQEALKRVNNSFLGIGGFIGSGIGASIGAASSTGNDSKYSNPALALVYDYDKLNDFGKIIMNQSSLYLTEENNRFTDVWTPKYQDISHLNDLKSKIDASKELVRLCRLDDNKGEAYKFIFWTMMVLTVDKSVADEKLSLICDFVRMLKITDEEMEDIFQVIKVLYHEAEPDFAFKSQNIFEDFLKVLQMYS
jgi:hypothetical protein